MKKIILISLIIVLTAVKCAPETTIVEIYNHTKSDYILTCTKDSIKNKKSYTDNYINAFDLMIIKDKFIEPYFIQYDFECFYKHEIDNKKMYIFYFIKKDNFEKSNYKFDSISIPCDELDIDKKIIFTIKKDKILLKNE